jgi:hypothetical protein
MNETEIKTRLGLILESAVGAALTSAGYSFDQDFQYDATCEVPDFLIPNGAKAVTMIEVHQTETRDSFRMKILRAFTAVTESKAFFGDELLSVNLLFGDPETELPPSNLKAMGGIYDLNLVPRRDCDDLPRVKEMEALALKLARDEECSTEVAGKQVVAKCGVAIASLGRLLKTKLKASAPKKTLTPVWDLERKRLKSLPPAPKAGTPTYYKKMMLRALFLADNDFTELVANKDPAKCSRSVQKQVLAVGLAKLEEEIDGDHYELDSEFSRFLKDPNAPNLRRLCKVVLDSVPAMHWFFEDIRDGKRRLQEAKEIIRLVNSGKNELVEGLVETLKSSNAFGIEHSRSWLADGLSIIAKQSQNAFNKRMVQTGRDPENYQYPYNNITGKFERLMGCPHHFEQYAEYAVDVFFEFTKLAGITTTPLAIGAQELADGILSLRLDGAVKLQRLNPLNVVLQAECSALGLVATPVKVESLVFDLAGGKGRLGKYDVFEFAKGQKKVMAVAVAVHDNHGDDKSKEWGARRQSSLYRIDQKGAHPSVYQDALFVLDGEWTDKDVGRLHRSGWNRIVRLAELESALRDIFGISKTIQLRPISSRRIVLTDMDEDLPMAAETSDEAPKLKRKGGHG